MHSVHVEGGGIFHAVLVTTTATLKVSHQAWEDAELQMLLRETAGTHLSQEQDGKSHMALPWALVLSSSLRCISQPKV